MASIRSPNLAYEEHRDPIQNKAANSKFSYVMRGVMDPVYKASAPMTYMQLDYHVQRQLIDGVTAQLRQQGLVASEDYITYRIKDLWGVRLRKKKRKNRLSVASSTGLPDESSPNAGSWGTKDLSSPADEREGTRDWKRALPYDPIRDT